MNKIISVTDYEKVLEGNKEKHIVEEDINCFQKDMENLNRLIERAKKEVQ